MFSVNFSPKEARGAWEAILGPLKYKKGFPLFVASLGNCFFSLVFDRASPKTTKKKSKLKPLKKKCQTD